MVECRAPIVVVLQKSSGQPQNLSKGCPDGDAVMYVAGTPEYGGTTGCRSATAAAPYQPQHDRVTRPGHALVKCRVTACGEEDVVRSVRRPAQQALMSPEKKLKGMEEKCQERRPFSDFGA